jgi:hypothetical protein
MCDFKKICKGGGLGKTLKIAGAGGAAHAWRVPHNFKYIIYSNLE